LPILITVIIPFIPSTSFKEHSGSDSSSSVAQLKRIQFVPNAEKGKNVGPVLKKAGRILNGRITKLVTPRTKKNTELEKLFKEFLI
jgi:hypothetical protein